MEYWVLPRGESHKLGSLQPILQEAEQSPLNKLARSFWNQELCPSSAMNVNRHFIRASDGSETGFGCRAHLGGVMQLKNIGPIKQESPTLAKMSPNVKAASPQPCICGSSENRTFTMSPAPQTRVPLALIRV